MDFTQPQGFAKIPPGLYREGIAGIHFDDDGYSHRRVTMYEYRRIKAIVGTYCSLHQELPQTYEDQKIENILEELSSTHGSTGHVAEYLNEHLELEKPIHRLHITNWIKGTWTIPDYVEKQIVQHYKENHV